MTYTNETQFDERKGATWHCIVGRNFGSFVTHGKEIVNCRRPNLYITLLIIVQRPSTSSISTWATARSCSSRHSNQLWDKFTGIDTRSSGLDTLPTPNHIRIRPHVAWEHIHKRRDDPTNIALEFSCVPSKMTITCSRSKDGRPHSYARSRETVRREPQPRRVVCSGSHRKVFVTTTKTDGLDNWKRVTRPAFSDGWDMDA
jgi:hypothetical protein